MDNGLHLYIGLALKMLDDNSALAIARDVNGETALHVLARKPLAFFKRNTSLCKSDFNRSMFLSTTFFFPLFCFIVRKY